MKRLVLDWRGTPNLSVPADLYSIGATVEQRPVTGNPQGRILVGISPTIYLHNGVVSGRPYNLALFDAATRLGAITDRVVWTADNGGGGSTVLFDLTKRGMLKAWLEILDQHFPWADGFHLDYFCRPDSLGIGTFTAEFLEAWDRALAGLGSGLRAKKPGCILIGQNDRMTGDTWSGMSGQWIEQRPTFNGRTAQIHAEDIAAFADLMKRYDPKREMVSVVEIREWQTFPARELDLVKARCIAQGLYLCLGRDGNVAP